MMQKFIVVLAALALLISAGCAAAPEETTSRPVPQTSAPTTQATTVPETTIPETTQPTVEITLVDNGNCAVILKGYDENALLGYGMNVYLENKTDKDLMFSVDDVSVNGFMCDPFWASTVSAGKKANEKVTFSEAAFAENGIEVVDEITFTLHVYDSNDLTADSLLKKTFTVNP